MAEKGEICRGAQLSPVCTPMSPAHAISCILHSSVASMYRIFFVVCLRVKHSSVASLYHIFFVLCLYISSLLNSLFLLFSMYHASRVSSSVPPMRCARLSCEYHKYPLDASVHVCMFYMHVCMFYMHVCMF